MRKSLYLSVPVRMDWGTEVAPFYQKYQGPFDLNFWVRGGPYNECTLDNCHGVVFFLPDNSWEYRIDELPAGVKSEVMRAYHGGQDLYIAYKANSGYNFYKAQVEGRKIKGISGTALSSNRVSDYSGSMKDSAAYRAGIVEDHYYDEDDEFVEVPSALLHHGH